MQAVAGEAFVNWSDSAAVVGLWEVVKRYGYFREQFQRALREIATINPDAVVLIDYPGFNLRLARALRRESPALKIIYYISPQVWAWNRGRIGQMARFLDLMLCIFPFEAELYNKSGLRTVFVGHPMIENLASPPNGRRTPIEFGRAFSRQPSSRESAKFFQSCWRRRAKSCQTQDDIHFEVAAASESLALEIGKMLQASLRAKAGPRRDW